ncbi:TonB-dependent receptor [Catalinimonas niigatensis]|uniref:TonB-dependent receptor n=1 Tax=Catalinimonas niigatensis TaxID=1397264 RepID=UPI002665488A|nr:TonB-dependent receptor [Catalinimonas niigatensis]WPP52065.1 TonB-dependent receptor [Catalinimonas niigatensis]
MRYFLISIFFMLALSSLTTETFAEIVVSGHVVDAETQEPLPGVNVVISTGNGTSTDMAGFFQLKLPSSTSFQLRFSFVGYQEQHISLYTSGDTTLSVQLLPAVLMTDEVIIESTKEHESHTQLIDRVSLNMEEIAKLPHLLGEVDPVRVVQMLPGVQNAGDGNTGFYVRGGEVDQNLILLDKATIYNASHLFGFFSVFNGNTIDQVSLDKGGIPAYYGGRLSSVLDIKTQTGDKQEWKGKGSLGLIAANIKVEGPIVKDKSSLMIAARRTYYDVLQKTLLQNTSVFKSGLDYFFYDLNLKWDYLLSKKNKITFSAYSGNDQFQYANFEAFQNEINWGNKAFSFQWQHAFSPRWFSETTVFGSQYKMSLGAKVSGYQIQVSSEVSEKGVHQEFVYTPNEKRTFTFGIRAIQYRFVPGAMQASTAADQTLDFGEVLPLHAQEGAVFFHHEYAIGEKWQTGLGVRASTFQQIGPFNRYLTDLTGRHQDTIHYQRNERIARHSGLEPRLSVSYSISKNTTLKASFDHTLQYIHMAPMSSVSLPTDVWVPSSALVKPQTANQYALGYYRLLAEFDLEGSVTGYYKQMHNQLEYQNGVLLGKGQYQNFDDKFYFGRGNSYGLEWMLKKNKGSLSGWVSYTLSRTTRKFDDINQGVSFPAKYDRLHNLSLLVNYRKHPQWHFSGVFVLASGNTMTLPVARYIMQGNIVNEYAGRNNFRLPSYHRLDLSATYYPISSAKFKSYWVFSLYNVYSRMNPYYVYFEAEGSLRDYSLEINARQVSLFPIIPSLSYNITF